LQWSWLVVAVQVSLEYRSQIEHFVELGYHYHLDSFVRDKCGDE